MELLIKEKVEPSYESEFSLKVKLMEKMLEALSKMVKGTGRKNPISLYDLFDNGNKKRNNKFRK